MKVLNLQCGAQHRFEGWFASEDDYQQQRGRDGVACPLCGDTVVAKLPSAPRLNLGAQPVAAAKPAQPIAPAGLKPDQPPAAGTAGAIDPLAALQARWLHGMRELVAHTEDVGPRFAEEARRIHYGEADERGIRGQASRAEAEALLDEGIDVMPLVLPEVLKKPLQ